MKKIILFSLLLAVIMTACYDDFKTDFDFTAAYFSYQRPVRTVIIDPASDKFEIKVGATIGGKYSYSGTEVVQFRINEALITDNQEYLDKGIKVMPSSWYTLSDDSEIKLSNSNIGFVTVSIDKNMMIANDDATKNTYVIPFEITDATTDSVLEGRDYSLVIVKFKNEFDGRYYIKGVDNILNVDGTVASSEVYNKDALVLNNYMYLNTLSATSLSSRVGSKHLYPEYDYTMNINPEDGKVIITAKPTSTVTELVGAAQYDFSKKMFYCEYNYKVNGVEHNVIDTLVYSNTEISLEKDW